MELTGTRALITGASRGVGEALALAFGAAGCSAALVARDGVALATLADRLDGRAYVVDLADAAQLDGLVSRIEADGGPIDVLVNAAAVARAALAEAVDEGEIARAVALNVTAPQRLVRQVLPGMLARERGHIVNVSSITGVCAVPATSLYGATKAALSHFSAGLRADLKGAPVGVTLVESGPVVTGMWEEMLSSPPVATSVRRLQRLRVLPTVGADQLAAAVVRAVQAGRYHVRSPKRALPLYALEDFPRRLVAGMLAGLDPRS